VVKVVNRRF